MTDRQALELMTKGALPGNRGSHRQAAARETLVLPITHLLRRIQKDGSPCASNFKSTHGDARRLKQFHEASLREGAVPLPVLDELLN